VWALPLASGFSAAAFAGSLYTQARNWIPGIAITATGGFAVWLITFFFLFPESKVKELDGKQSTTTSSSTITPATPRVPPEPATVFAADFLSLLDAGDYAKAYYSLNDNLKNQTDQIGFVQGMKQHRDRRGKLLDRRVFNMNDMQNPPGSPPGQYSQVVYQSNFEKSSQTTETLVLVLTANNTWKVFDYHLWPPS
jgi:Protein of unknown function (DUF4019)